MQKETGIIGLILIGTVPGCASIGLPFDRGPKRIAEVPYSHVVLYLTSGEGLSDKYQSLDRDLVSAQFENFVSNNGFKVVDRSKTTQGQILEELDRCVYSGRYKSESCSKVGEMLGAEAILHVKITSAGPVESLWKKLLDLLERKSGGKHGEEGAIGAKFDVRVRMMARLVRAETRELDWAGADEGIDVVFEEGRLGKAPDDCIRKLMRDFPRHVVRAAPPDLETVEPEGIPN